MSSTGAVPDAWDDDWVNVADNKTEEPSKPEPAPKLTKAERRAQHAQQQRQLWHSAENPGRSLWLEAQGVVPLQNEIKPQVKLLSRKPATIAKRDVTDAAARLNMEDEEDSGDEARRKREAELEARQRQAKLEREDKQRRYAEARERIMGSSNNPSPPQNSRDSPHGRDNRKQRGVPYRNGNRRSQPESPAEQSPSTLDQSNNGSQLFDPEDMGRRLPPKRDMTDSPRDDNHPLRQPRGPSENGRGGFGFSGRDGRPGA
ncbi:Hypothetical predicted protein [Lecanosticta acicola]|uniref:SUZ domain-containing protein n=1 Tax=Lecanosticta acicola TaxID=111012 RepID=A0AAI8Z019_9PEZI|nr:Hypothetical predicted protein [Lecanosticta acicola]